MKSYIVVTISYYEGNRVVYNLSIQSYNQSTVQMAEWLGSYIVLFCTSM